MIRTALFLFALLPGCNLAENTSTANPAETTALEYVIVAYRELPAGVPITKEDLFAVQISKDYIADGVLQNPELVYGRIPTQRILKDEFIRVENLLAVGSKGPQAVVGDLSQFTTQWAGSGKASITPFARGNEAFIGHLWLDAGAAVPEHQDETEEYLYILAGGGTLLLDGQSHEISAGHGVYMPAKATVSFKNGDQPLEAIQVFAGPKSADKYAAWGEKPK